MNLTKKYLLLIILNLLVDTSLYALDSQTYLQAEQYFNEQQYKKAKPLLEEEALKGSQASMYRLGFMYKNGLGVKQSDKKAAFWFQESASEYSFTLNMKSNAEIEKKSFTKRISAQLDPSTNKKGAEYALSKMDTNTPETKELISSHIKGDFFGLKPHKTNFLLPVSYSSKKYARVNAGDLNAPTTYYDKNYEVEFQISLKKPLTYNLFGFNEYITAAYTQKVWWQLYSDSGPFRETNYLPELFITIPSSQDIDDKYGLKSIRTGFVHESNGQEGYRSRSWNRLYLSGQFQLDNLFIKPRVWYRISEDEKSESFNNGTNPNAKGDDNPNIYEYLGYGDLELSYLFGKHEIGSEFRYNFGAGGTNRGSINAHWSYPFFNSKNTFWYVKFFNGYGESLIDYDKSVTKTAFGFSFSRGLY